MDQPFGDGHAAMFGARRAEQQPRRLRSPKKSIAWLRLSIFRFSIRPAEMPAFFYFRHRKSRAD
jgi:hypothetical protein